MFLEEDADGLDERWDERWEARGGGLVEVIGRVCLWPVGHHEVWAIIIDAAADAGRCD